MQDQLLSAEAKNRLQLQSSNKINPSLDNIKSALDILGNPQDSFKSIQVGGTNGKGSTCTYLELIYLDSKERGLLDSSLKIGKYTSPHLVSITERVSINGQDISQEDFDGLWVDLFEAGAAPLREDSLREQCGFQLTGFEKFTVIAFEYFKREQVDIAILEVGLGGRWDATNVIKPEHTLATAITNVGLDHQDYLGETIEEIRKEKEAIIKPDVPHFGFSPETIVKPVANALSSEDYKQLNYKLAKELFESINGIKLEEEQEFEILKQFKNRHKARLDYDPERNILVDCAHNPDAAKLLSKFIVGLGDNQGVSHELNSEVKKQTNFARKIYILGLLDKDYKGFIDNLELQDEDIVLFTNIDSERSTNAKDLQAYLQESHSGLKENIVFENLEETLAYVSRIKKDSDLLVITGSIYLLGEYFKLS